MAMPVNLAFLEPQAIMKGLTKLTFWASSARRGQKPKEGSGTGFIPTGSNMRFGGGADALQLLQGLFGGLDMQVGLVRGCVTLRGFPFTRPSDRPPFHPSVRSSTQGGFNSSPHCLGETGKQAGGPWLGRKG